MKDYQIEGLQERQPKAVGSNSARGQIFAMLTLVFLAAVVLTAICGCRSDNPSAR